MLNDHQTALVSLLLGSFPNFQSGDGEAALAAYELVLSEADGRDLQPGVMILINGELPGHDGRFAPTAPQLARAIRYARDKRLDREIAARKSLPAPEDTWVDDDPETKAKNRARLDDLAKQLGQAMATEESNTNRLRKDIAAKTNQRFAPSFEPSEMAARLGFAKVTTFNSADDDQYDLGGERVA